MEKDEIEKIQEKTIEFKLNKIKIELAKLIGKKSGENSYAHFKYYQLEDFLPQALVLFDKYSLYNEFYIDTELEVIDETITINTVDGVEIPTRTVHKKPVEYGYIYIKDLQTGDDNLYRLKTAEATISGASAIQNLGGKLTYMKRYAYMNLLDITEPDSFDAAPQQKVITNNVTPYDMPKVNNVVQSIAQSNKQTSRNQPASHTESGVPQGYPAHNTIINETQSSDLNSNIPMTLETKTVIAQTIIAKGLDPANTIRDIAASLGTTVDTLKENQKEQILNKINNM